MTIYAQGLTKQWRTLGKHTWINSKPCISKLDNKKPGISDFNALKTQTTEHIVRKRYGLQKGNKQILRGPGKYRSI